MPKRRSTKAVRTFVNPPFPYDEYDTTRYNLEQIAIEFILWDTSFKWSYTERCKWIMLAIAYNYPEQEWEGKLQAFPNAYKAALEIERSSLAATPEEIHQLIACRPLKEWPSKDCDRWDTPSD
jgi:hypothetical protein